MRRNTKSADAEESLANGGKRKSADAAKRKSADDGSAATGGSAEIAECGGVR